MFARAKKVYTTNNCGHDWGENSSHFAHGRAQSDCETSGSGGEHFSSKHIDSHDLHGNEELADQRENNNQFITICTKRNNG